MKRIAILDIGKTNAKVVVLDAASGEEIVANRISNTVLCDGPYPHYDIEALWRFFLKSLAAFAKEPGFDTISITTHGAAAALVAADGTLAMPVLDYELDYPAEILAAYAAIKPDFKDTFSPPLSLGLNLGAQLHYLKTTFPADFARAHFIFTYPQYWAWRLTGIAASEVTSLGCHTDLWLPKESAFSTCRPAGHPCKTPATSLCLRCVGRSFARDCNRGRPLQSCAGSLRHSRFQCIAARASNGSGGPVLGRLDRDVGGQFRRWRQFRRA
ncbi:FGGY family of carbohydrate kinase, N-terminal domain protein [Brucella lupini]|uniref:FGGY family of carbohydrate kinase, N-terminal domain protein n=1 Tax=Brucella lupini TaxID=255457 RepID=A0A256GCD0_9HYPH|nr:FGGY family of carbohydrate kinase, N-terminal domain protein [Brucella lupini]